MNADTKVALDDIRAGANKLEADLAAAKVFEQIVRSLALHPEPRDAEGRCVLCARELLPSESLFVHSWGCEWRRAREQVW